jgi:hypothetical protein
VISVNRNDSFAILEFKKKRLPLPTFKPQDTFINFMSLLRGTKYFTLKKVTYPHKDISPFLAY